MKIKMKRKTGLYLLFTYVLFFQVPLEQIHPVFKNIDELFALAFFPILFLRGSKIKIKKETGVVIALLACFLVVGVAGNIKYRYQPTNLVIIDIITNLKFFLAIGTGMLLVGHDGLSRLKRDEPQIRQHLYFISTILFVLFLIDRMLNIWPSEIRYGIRSAKLCFFHPTYLAGACVFLISCLLLFYEKKSIPYLGIDFVVLLMTLRGKAIVAAAVAAVLVVYIFFFKGKIKRWHIIAFGILAVVLGWNQIDYYYIRNKSWSPRAVMLLTAFLIISEYFPIGTGFATYASNAAADHYSPVYIKYGFQNNPALSRDSKFLTDTFWPIILGQTGFIGTVAYITILMFIFRRIWNTQKYSIRCFVSGLFIFLYFIISSTSEATFNNSIAVPLAMLLGIILSENYGNQQRRRSENGI